MHPFVFARAPFVCAVILRSAQDDNVSTWVKLIIKQATNDEKQKARETFVWRAFRKGVERD